MAVLIPPGPIIILGGFGAFNDFEIPDVVRSTPTQNAVIHKFIGGARQIDVLGEDDDVIKWSGTFLGPDASERALALDQVLLNGDPQFLTWGVFGYTVVIKQVAFDFRGPHLIDYAIECYVLSNGEDNAPAGINANAQAPLNAAGGIAGF